MNNTEKWNDDIAILKEIALVGFQNGNIWEDLKANKNNAKEKFNDWVSIIPRAKDAEEDLPLKNMLDSLVVVSLSAILKMKDKPMDEAQQWFETLAHNGASFDKKNSAGMKLTELACLSHGFEVAQLLTRIGFEGIGEERTAQIFKSHLNGMLYILSDGVEKLTSNSGLKWLKKHKRLIFSNQNDDEQLECIWFAVSRGLNESGIFDDFEQRGTQEQITSRIKLCELILEQDKNNIIPLLLWNTLAGISWQNEPSWSHNPLDKDTIRKHKMSQSLPKLYETIKKYKYANNNDEFSVRVKMLEDLNQTFLDGHKHLAKTPAVTELKSRMTLFCMYGLQKLVASAQSMPVEQKKELTRKTLNSIAEKAQVTFEDEHTPDPELVASAYSYLRDSLRNSFSGKSDFFVPEKASPYMVCLEYMNGFPEDEKNKKIIEYLSQFSLPSNKAWLDYLDGPFNTYLSSQWKNALFKKNIKKAESKLEIENTKNKATFRF